MVSGLRGGGAGVEDDRQCLRCANVVLCLFVYQAIGRMPPGQHGEGERVVCVAVPALSLCSGVWVEEGRVYELSFALASDGEVDVHVSLSALA